MKSHPPDPNKKAAPSLELIVRTSTHGHVAEPELLLVVSACVDDEPTL